VAQNRATTGFEFRLAAKAFPATDKEITMKSISYKILVVMILAASLSGCSTVRHESAMEWMMRQPWDTLP
jgi:hypothetical protein